MQAPPAEQDTYLYGARRFIALKPKELVIADDGGYVEAFYESNENGRASPKEFGASENKNRVVTIDLESESLSAVDVSVSFDASLSTGTSYGVQ